jgi:hypothetical protein
MTGLDWTTTRERESSKLPSPVFCHPSDVVVVVVVVVVV